MTLPYRVLTRAFVLMLVMGATASSRLDTVLESSGVADP